MVPEGHIAAWSPARGQELDHRKRVKSLRGAGLEARELMRPRGVETGLESPQPRKGRR